MCCLQKRWEENHVEKMGVECGVGALRVLEDGDKEEGTAEDRSAAATGRRMASCGWAD